MRLRVEESQRTETRDSLREEISNNLEEKLTEHEVITEKVICNDSMKVERMTDRVTVRERAARTEAKKEEVRVVKDTVFIEKRGSVSATTHHTNGTNGRASPVVLTLKWGFWIIIAIGGMIITVTITKK